MIGRADIEESKSNVAMNAWLPQASYPCGNQPAGVQGAAAPCPSHAQHSPLLIASSNNMLKNSRPTSSIR